MVGNFSMLYNYKNTEKCFHLSQSSVLRRLIVRGSNSIKVLLDRNECMYWNCLLRISKSLQFKTHGSQRYFVVYVLYHSRDK